MKRGILLVFAVVLCLAAMAQSAEGPTLQPNLQVVSGIQKLGMITRNQFLRQLNKRMQVEGLFYDGSIPMLVENMELVRADKPIPRDKYIPIVGPRPSGVKWGDKVRATGMIRKPGPGDPPYLQGEQVFVQVEKAENMVITAPSILRRYDPTKISIIGRPVVIGPIAYKKYAVLIAGGYDAANNHIRYWNDLKTMYNILKSRGYNAANIYVIYADREGKDASMPVNYSATKANISTVFSTLQTKLLANDTVYIMLNDHGGSGTGDPSGDETVTHTDEVLWLWNGVAMTDDEFAVQMNKIPSATKVTMQMKQCYSGGYIDDHTRANRIVMSSASATQISYGRTTLDYGEFTFWYFAALTGSKPDGSGAVNADANGNGSISILEAYNFARSHDGAPETPHYEDNGVKPDHSGAMPAGGEGTLGAATSL